jgi:alpha/beta hydrolase fold
MTINRPSLVRTTPALRRIAVGEVTLFYREAGAPERPTLLLLHGFPSSSHMFRNLIPLFADQFHVVALDLPGFGFTTAPERGQLNYSFDNLAEVVRAFTDAIGLDRYAIYVFDYGAPAPRLVMGERCFFQRVRLNNSRYLSSLSGQPAPRLDDPVGNTPSRCGRRSFPWSSAKGPDDSTGT